MLFEVGDQIKASDGAYTYELICCKPGLIGNAYSGSILPVTPGTGIKSAVIGEILIPGTADETDESLRARFLKPLMWLRLAVTSRHTGMRSLPLMESGLCRFILRGKAVVQYCAAFWTGELTPAESGLVKQVQATICPTEESGTSASANGYGIARSVRL